MSRLHKAALRYLELGYHPIPCQPRDKKPLVNWLPYQDRPPTVDELRAWWTETPDANVALALGRGVFAVDLDGDGAESLLHMQGIVLPDAAPRVRTGSGQHVYFRTDRKIGNRAALLSTNGGKPQVDIRGDGGYVLAPPSIHPNGATYEWIGGYRAPADAPPALLALLAEPPPRESASPHLNGDGTWIVRALRGVGEGSRDDTATRLAGYFVKLGMPEEIVVEVLADFATRCSPPFPERDVVRIVRSVARVHARKHPPGEESPEAPKADELPAVQHISDALADAVMAIERGPQRMLATPFPGLNRVIVGGFQPGELVYIGARPGVGKTALALEVARKAASSGHKVLIVSREMLNAALARRMISQEGKISASDLKLGRITDREEFEATLTRLAGLPIWLTDKARTITQVRALAESAKPALVIVDYLQLVRAPSSIGERRLQVEFVSSSLKNDVAMQLQTVVICMSSLARPADQKDDRPPTMASLKESSNLEHDADTIILVHRKTNEREAKLIVPKTRDGGTGVVNLIFQPEWVSFAELEYDSDAQWGIRDAEAYA